MGPVGRDRRGQLGTVSPPGAAPAGRMPDVIVFNHIPKTAGTTMKHVLWRAVGSRRVLTSLAEDHRERLAAIAAELDRELERPCAIAHHIGFGIEARLPARHSYRAFTFLRDPVERTVSRYWHYRAAAPRASGREPSEPLEEWLQTDVIHRYNSQAGFLGGLWTRHNLDGAPLQRAAFDDELLAVAKRNLESHAVIGLAERFDESMLLLRGAFGWPLRKTTYRRANRSNRQRPLTAAELAAVRANNELDLELYEFGRELFEARLAARCEDRERRLRHFGRLNRAYGRLYPATVPARVVARSLRRS